MSIIKIGNHYRRKNEVEVVADLVRFQHGTVTYLGVVVKETEGNGYHFYEFIEFMRLFEEVVAPIEEILI